ncbi:MAG: formylglycine-generating enzyme family protein [Spirochaetes bacterium]|nr:formylglycine-generating enzyme family protein [Spirochaetota bacterium]
MNSVLSAIIEKIVEKYGEQVLEDPRRVAALLAKLAGEVPKPQKYAFVKSLEHDFVPALKGASEADRAGTKERLAGVLNTEEGLDMALCVETLVLLEKALFGEVLKKFFCKNCKKELQKGWRYCPFCATSIVERPRVVASVRAPTESQVGQRGVSPTGIKVVWIPPGSFKMGSPSNEMGRRYKEGPQRLVTISGGFWMGVHLVTQEQWVRVMGYNPSHFFSNPAPGETQGRRPVEMVSWYDSLVFANRLSMIEKLSPAYSINGSTNPEHWDEVPADSNVDWDAVEIVEGSTGWRLPTEAQWEYAARAGTTTDFSNGTIDYLNEAELDGIGWFEFNSDRITREVGRKLPNKWGLHDVHGNVWEWVWDWFEVYPSQAETDPTGTPSGSVRVGRGGSWVLSVQFARSAVRNFDHPFYRSNGLGVRIIRPRSGGGH